MARTAITKQVIVRAGITPTYEAANVDGNSVDNDDPGMRFLHVKNGDASQHTVTVVTPGNVQGLAVADLSVDIAAGGEAMIGPFPGSAFNQDDGSVHVDYDAVTSVTIAALEVV